MKRLLLLTLSLLTPAAAGWQSAAIPDNPAGQQLAKTMAAIASDSGADVAAFVKTFSASLLAVVPLAEQMKTFEQLHDEYGALSVVRIEASDAHSIVAALAPKGSPARLRVRLTTDPVAPNAIRTLTFEKLQAAAGDHASALERARNAFAEGR